jgi:hypothetical protein
MFKHYCVISTFTKQTENPSPVIDAKLNSKTHLQQGSHVTFKILKWVQKENTKYDADFETAEKVEKLICRLESAVHTNKVKDLFSSCYFPWTSLA